MNEFIDKIIVPNGYIVNRIHSLGNVFNHEYNIKLTNLLTQDAISADNLIVEVKKKHAYRWFPGQSREDIYDERYYVITDSSVSVFKKDMLEYFQKTKTHPKNIYPILKSIFPRSNKGNVIAIHKTIAYRFKSITTTIGLTYMVFIILGFFGYFNNNTTRVNYQEISANQALNMDINWVQNNQQFIFRFLAWGIIIGLLYISGKIYENRLINIIKNYNKTENIITRY